MQYIYRNHNWAYEVSRVKKDLNKNVVCKCISEQ